MAFCVRTGNKMEEIYYILKYYLVCLSSSSGVTLICLY